MSKKFYALRFVGTIYKIIGILIGILTLIGSLFMCVMPFITTAALGDAFSNFGYSLDLGGAELIGGLFLGFGALFYGTLVAVTFYALGEIIYLLLAVEENTRQTSMTIAELIPQRSIAVSPPAAPPATVNPSSPTVDAYSPAETGVGQPPESAPAPDSPGSDQSPPSIQ